ncbi:hypothetical protein ACZ91_21590 [Streptomyces regensis]|nr:hypothetical protein ACZ91_21590 [Streptomyces regensis]
MEPGPRSSSRYRVRAAIRPMAVSQSQGTSRPLSRTSGLVSRSGEPFACQPYRSLGPRRPRLTRSVARPRTPTMRPCRTAMSMASPLECSTEADGTQRSTSSSVRPGVRCRSVRTGQGVPRSYGVRGPQGSPMRSSSFTVPPRGVASRRRAGTPAADQYPDPSRWVE